ncbi:MAG: hypothetical protein BI182_02040 [Acetobacterium sp. MES1]|uniref:DUF3298 domain-containing protein n=1 Tax=Acetobacterium sp. MES1 TaxID=1899015 RepID=UPI000B9D0BC4|nr:DUF3298 domain-containing protein [Acetobacterium sp. MES1]OXS26513.1 MAG: hypothetical protein BI182_02040 [Acetobacterium sp. MES1]
MKNKLYRLAVMLVTILMVLTLPQSILAETIDTATLLPTANYRTHVQNIGWQDWKSAGQTSGTSGQSLRLEAIEITLNDQGYDLGVAYQTHVQNIGWQELKYNGETSGTSGQSLRLEAIRIFLSGSDANLFDIYYRVHAQNLGWLGWAKNGESAGSAGLSYRLEAIEIVIVAKNGAAPGSTLRPFVSVYNMGIAQTQEQNYYDIDTLRWVYGSRYERPIFYDNSLVQMKLDIFYEALENSWVQTNNADYMSFVYAYTTDPVFRQNLIGKYENNVTAAITYNNNNIISVTQEQYRYNGGAHGNSELTAHSFGTRTGDELLLGDLLAIPDSQISAKLTAEFQQLKNSDPNYSDIDLTAIASKLGANSPYYLTTTGVCVFFNPYEVAPGALGRVELLIPYSRTDLLVEVETLI